MISEPINIASAVTALRALANPARLRIALRLLAAEQAVSDLESHLGIRQPTLSQHLADLREAGIVATRRDSRAIFYRLADPDQQRLVGALLQGFGGVGAGNPPPRPQAASGPTSPAAMFAVIEARS